MVVCVCVCVYVYGIPVPIRITSLPAPCFKIDTESEQMGKFNWTAFNISGDSTIVSPICNKCKDFNMTALGDSVG